MGEKTFEILGIAPTQDGRAIRAAFLRLARIYHPDRFAGMPEDVREEAERRMKDVTHAYELLRLPYQERDPEKPGLNYTLLRERAEEYAKAIAAKRAEERVSRARWRRWEELERQARDRASLEAEIAATIAMEHSGAGSPRAQGASTRANGAPVRATRSRPAEPEAPKKKSQESLLSQRLNAARLEEAGHGSRRALKAPEAAPSSDSEDAADGVRVE